ncbi:MAG: SDR family oxidoreductase [Acidimicrobiaceae bacterium]|nr:SDR family oxidoreductase [Acidimicrobiaceae bacterium]
MAGDDGKITLDGKVAVVTGSGRGLGQAYAEALAAAGAAVIVNDIDADVAGATVERIRSAGGQAASVVVPVGPTAAADELVAKAVEEFGRLDIMVTNAGVLRDKTLKNMSDEDFDLVVETHLRGTFTCGRAAAAQFREQGGGGRLILVGSPAGQRGNFGQTNYSAVKAGIVAISWVWAMELARDEITVNALVPVAMTRMVATIPRLREVAEAAERGEPVPEDMRQGGLGMAVDVAPLVVFLASDAAAGITGQAIGLGGDKLALWSRPEETSTLVRSGGWDAEAIAGALGPTFDGTLHDPAKAGGTA